MKKLFVSLVLGFLLCISGFSQGTDILDSEKARFFCSFNLSPSSTQFSYKLPAAYNAGLINSPSFHTSLEFGYFISRTIGITVGLGYSSYAAKLSIDTHHDNFPFIDSEDDTLHMSVAGNKIVEQQKIGLLNIPVSLVFQFPISPKLGFIIQPALEFGLPVSKNYKSTGVFSYSGYYSQYNVVISNLPAYGFPSNHATSVSNDLVLKPVITSMMVSAGMYYSINQNLKATLCLNYSASLSDISAYSNNSEYRISEFVDNINSLMAVSSRTTFQSIGIRLGVQYLF